MDIFTQITDLFPLKTSFTVIAIVFVNSVEIATQFSSGTIVLYHDILFLSNFWQNMLSNSRSTLHYSSTYHPQSDGQIKVANHYLEQYLHVFIFHEPHQWHPFLPWAAWAIIVISTTTLTFSLLNLSIVSSLPLSLVHFWFINS